MEDGVDGGGGLAGDGSDNRSSPGGSGGGISRTSTLIGRRLAGGNSSGDLVGHTDREDSPLHSKRSSMCLLIDGERVSKWGSGKKEAKRIFWAFYVPRPVLFLFQLIILSVLCLCCSSVLLCILLHRMMVTNHVFFHLIISF